uniref:Phosphatidylethanolamine-binding protein n=1 Tax=viral metagenome TaxID=1070528 RepID=A0A6C0JVS3_9ZZZZ
MRGRTRKMRGGSRLNVTFGQIKATGQLVNKRATIEKPIVKWATEPDTYYTIICIDPDAVAKSWLHWMVVNCEGGNPDSGSELVKWAPPTPPSGTHNYIFYLFSHTYKIAVDPPEQRGYFKIDEFVKNNGLYKKKVTSIKVSSK